MTIEGTVKDSALSCTNTRDISAQAVLAMRSTTLPWTLGWLSPECLKKDLQPLGGAKMK